MTESRLAPLTGVAYTILLLAAVALIQNFSFLPSGGEALAFFEGGGRAITAGAYLGAAASFFLVWFGGSLASHLREYGAERMSVIALGGAVFAAVASAVGFGMLAAGAERTVMGGGVSPDTAATLYDVSAVMIGNAGPFGFALVAGAVALAGVTVFPRWLVWTSGVLGIGLLSPFNYAVIGLAVVWVPVVGLWLYRKTASETAVITGPVGGSSV